MQFRNMSIRRKILLSMLLFTLLPIVLVASLATEIAYRTIRQQLIYNHRMSSAYLAKRLSLASADMADQFYAFEINKEVKAAILPWCAQDGRLDYAAQWRIITFLNTMISIDGNINSIELYNLRKEEVLVARRSGAQLRQSDGEALRYLQGREDRRANLFYLREGSEILAAHPIYRFDVKRPIALLVVRMRTDWLRNILAEMKSVPEESVLIYNDQGRLIEADLGEGWTSDEPAAPELDFAFVEQGRDEDYFSEQFWFYRGADGERLQVILSVPNVTMVNALRSTLISSLVVALFAVLASVICSVVYSRSVSRPIRNLSDQMRTLKLDEYARGMADGRRDEIGILQESFDHMLARNKELIEQQYQSKLEKREAQLRALQAQINPHFMYNTLQTIGGMALDKQAPDIYQITLALSDIMRYSLNFSEELIALEEEIKYLKGYIMIQNARFDGQVRLELALDPDSLDCLIPKLILQPLAENSFRHGLLDKAGERIITLGSEVRAQGDLILYIRDNGRGLDETRLKEIRARIERDAAAALKSGTHVGLANVQARIKLHCPGEAYGITIESAPEGGTTVSVRMSILGKGGRRLAESGNH